MFKHRSVSLSLTKFQSTRRVPVGCKKNPLTDGAGDFNIVKKHYLLRYIERSL